MRSRGWLFYYVLISAALHLLLYLVVFLFLLEGASPKQVKSFIEVEIVEPIKTFQKGQIVEQGALANNNDIDTQSKFLSERNQKVHHQTLARRREQLKLLIPKYSDIKSEKGGLSRHHQSEVFIEKTNASTSDYIKGIDSGFETILSTREFVYYSYYSRIRNQLSDFWSSKVREKLLRLFMEGRHIASTEDKITRCLITLDEYGRLIKIQIVGRSGVSELDEAAIEALKLAGPFPNPPRGLIEADRTVKIRWDFVLEM